MSAQTELLEAHISALEDENIKLRSALDECEKALEKITQGFAPNDPPMLKERTLDWSVGILREALARLREAKQKEQK